MASLLTSNRKLIFIAGCLVFLISAAVLALNVRTGGQRAQGSQGSGRDEALRQIEESPEQPLRILGNDDCPLRITEAKVKEVPGTLFTSLTGKTTDLATVSSVPEVKLLNASGRTITKFILIVRDPVSRKTRGVIQHDIALRPGETYTISRELFVTPDAVAATDAAGRAEQALVNPGIKSEKGWIEFAARPALFVTVGLVNFEDGSDWKVKEGAEVSLKKTGA